MHEPTTQGHEKGPRILSFLNEESEPTVNGIMISWSGHCLLMCEAYFRSGLVPKADARLEAVGEASTLLCEAFPLTGCLTFSIPIFTLPTRPIRALMVTGGSPENVSTWGSFTEPLTSLCGPVENAAKASCLGGCVYSRP